MRNLPEDRRFTVQPATEDGSGQPDNDAIDAARRKEERYVGPHELAEMAAKERIEQDLRRALDGVNALPPEP